MAVMYTLGVLPNHLNLLGYRIAEVLEAAPFSLELVELVWMKTFRLMGLVETRSVDDGRRR